MAAPLPEYWQTGPIPGITSYLQPAAHAILQAHRETIDLMQQFPAHLLGEKPGGMASPAFHLQHMAGVLDRLFTYARGSQLSPAQLDDLKQEAESSNNYSLVDLLHRLNIQVDLSIDQLKETSEEMLLVPREVGRKRIPSNTIGLLFHAAEHLQRHVGQLLVTVKVIQQDQTTASRNG